MKGINFEGNECTRVRTHLDSYLNSELLVETNQEVLNHLESCAECARALQDRARVKAQLRRAVLNDQAPYSLMNRIRTDIRHTRGFTFNFRTSWVLAAAAAVVFLAVGLGVLFRSNTTPNNSGPRPLSLSAEVEPGDAAGQILRVGFNDHVFCAMDHGMANKRFSSEQMSDRLGPQYEGLVALVNEKMREDYTVVVGHRCHYQNREFVHLILRRQEEVVSLIVTRKSGEALPQGAAVTNTAGTAVYEASWHDLQVAGMETRDHLVFVVSNTARADNGRIASALAPVVGDFIKKIEA